MYKYRFFFVDGTHYDYAVSVSEMFTKKELILGAASLMKQDYVTTDDRAINIANVTMIELVEVQEDTK